jgi:hypothetical protein
MPRKSLRSKTEELLRETRRLKTLRRGNHPPAPGRCRQGLPRTPQQLPCMRQRSRRTCNGPLARSERVNAPRNGSLAKGKGADATCEGPPAQ